jgi:hypothetical protein
MTVTAKQMQATAGAHIAYMSRREDETPSGRETKTAREARLRWYGSMEAAESITGVDRMSFARGLHTAYINYILSGERGVFGPQLAVASQLAANINQSLAGAFDGILSEPAPQMWAEDLSSV